MLPSISKRRLSAEGQCVVQQAARNDVATTKPEAAMATPAIGDNISDPSKGHDVCGCGTSAQSYDALVRDANETGSEHRGISLQ